MSTIINATTTNGVVIQPDNSGSLVLQTNNGTTALTISTAQDTTLAGKLTSAGALTLASNGTTTAITIDTSQRAAFVAGTAALPAITTTGDTNTGMWFPAADTIAFSEGGTEAMRIDSSGNVLIGTTGATCLLSAGPVSSKGGLFGSANTAGSPGIQGAHTVNSGTGYVAYFANSGSSTGLYISNTAAWQSTSDVRLKTDIKDLDTTSRLLQLRPVDYLWKSQETSDNPEKRNLGFIAQEVQEAFPELVGQSPDGMLSVEYTGLIAPLVKAIQEQQTIINDLKARIETLEAN